MTRTTWAAIAVAVVTGAATGACVTVDDGGDVGASQQASTGQQGLHLQGLHLQGLHLQGLHLQGLHLQGLHLQGLHLQGNAMSGVQVAVTDIRGSYPTPNRACPTAIREQHLLYYYTWCGRTRTGPFAGTMEGATFPVDLSGFDDSGASTTVTVDMRIAAVAQDSSTTTMAYYPSNDDVLLVGLEIDTDLGWVNVCDSGEGFFLNGTWDDTGAYSPGGVTFACTNGVISKCARGFGYAPWRVLQSPYDGTMQPMLPFHQLCTRAARADYCLNGVSYTVEKTPIDLHDNHDFNTRSTPEEVGAFLGSLSDLPSWYDPSDFVTESLFLPASIRMNHARWIGLQTELTCELPDISSEEELDGLFEASQDTGSTTPMIAVRSSPQVWGYLEIPILTP